MALMFDLIHEDQNVNDAALEAIVTSGDRCFIAVLLEMLRGRQVGIVGGLTIQYAEALEELSNQPLGNDWPAWVDWYGRSDLTPPPGFTGWKG